MQDRTIHYVVLAARYGSFTAAAERAGVTQSAITKSVGELEQQLGFAIFSRTARGVVVTMEGRVFVDRASRVLDDLGRLMRTPHLTDHTVGPLRLGVGPAVLEWVALPPVAELMRRHPGVKIDFSSSTFDRAVDQLRNGGIDVAMGLDAAWAELPEFKREQLPTLRTAYFVKLGHPLLERRSVPRSALAEYHFVTPSISQPYGADIREIFENEGVDATTRMHSVDYFPLVKVMVGRSNAIGVVSLSYARSEAFKRRFGLIDLEHAIAPSSLCCAVRRRWEQTPIVRAFISACRETLPSTLS